MNLEWRCDEWMIGALWYFIMFLTMKCMMHMTMLCLANYNYDVSSWAQEQVQYSKREGKYYLGELGLATLNKPKLRNHTLTS